MKQDPAPFESKVLRAGTFINVGRTNPDGTAINVGPIRDDATLPRAMTTPQENIPIEAQRRNRSVVIAL
jgi:hypothetical protein